MPSANQYFDCWGIAAQVLWECGGTLAAPAITGATIHKAMAFIAPKLVGGVRAPTPVGELGNVEMTQVTDTTKILLLW